MFYLYNQNNSGGGFDSDDSVCHYVIIEANNAEQANDKAKSIGIYFDGCETGMDCPCCGDRWSEAWGDGMDEPLIYGKAPDYKGENEWSRCDHWAQPGEVYCRVYYLDGSKKEYVKN